ncbi:MAG: TIR domain-containing protein [Hyphomicrobiales bacterium]
MIRPLRPQIFVSYHHKNDQYYYDDISNRFSTNYAMIRDQSLNREIKSDDTDYVMRKIREDYITGTSCTFVLIGSETHKRMYVDWEIKATLDKEHGLLGIILPTAETYNNTWTTPARFHDNYSGNMNGNFAELIQWDELVLYPTMLAQTIQKAKEKSSILIDNSRPMKTYNG